jgi:hypothetical protein
MSDCNVRVICRFRPINKRELEEGGDVDVLNNILMFPDEGTINLQAWNNRAAQIFAFDRVFWSPTTTQVYMLTTSSSRSIQSQPGAMTRCFNRDASRTLLENSGTVTRLASSNVDTDWRHTHCIAKLLPRLVHSLCVV